MSRRIIGSIVGVVLVTLLLTGTGTFVLARFATTRDDLSRLERKAAQTNELFVSEITAWRVQKIILGPQPPKPTAGGRQ